MKNFYAVKKGKKIGIYTTWEECKKAIGNFKKAKFKGFETRKEAEEYLKEDITCTNEDILEKIHGRPYAFVDGSFNKSTRTYGYGGFLITPSGEKYILQGSGNDPEMASMRNVSGEISGSIAAMKKAVELGLSELVILYDYIGIAKWATGKWKRNKDGTRKYHKLCKAFSLLLEIEFIKVSAHSGIEGNEEADRLAKEAVGIILPQEMITNTEISLI